MQEIEKEIMKLRIKIANLKDTVKNNPYDIGSRITNTNYRYDTSYMKLPHNIPYDSNHVMVSNTPSGVSILIPYIQSNKFSFIYSNSGGENFGQGYLDYDFDLVNPVIIGVKQFGDSSFSVLIYDDNNTTYLFKSSYSSQLRCQGAISSGCVPLSYDISNNGMYITILMKISDIINCFHSSNFGSHYENYQNIVEYSQYSLSVSPIKLSSNGKIQRFYVSYEDNSHKIFTCNMLDQNVFSFTSQKLDLQYEITNKKIIDIKSDDLCSNILLLFEDIETNIKSIAYTEGLGDTILKVNSFYTLEDGGSIFSSFDKVNNFVIITLENSNDILFSSNSGMSFNRIRNIVNCETINICKLYNGGSSICFIYTYEHNKYILCIDISTNNLSTKIIDARILEKFENKKFYWLSELDSTLIFHTHDVDSDININITRDVIRKMQGKTLTVIKICNYQYFEHEDNENDNLVLVRLRIVNSDTKPDNFSFFYPDRRSFQLIEGSSTSIKLFSDGTYLYVV